MQISIKGKQLDVGAALRTHVSDALGQIVAKYFDNPMECSVVLSRNAHLIRTDISAHVGRGILLQAHAEATDPYAAFDTAADKVAKRLRRYKRRLRDHHRVEAGEGLPAQQYVLRREADDTEEPEHTEAAPAIVAEMQANVETLSVSEAVMRMELADAPALMFRNRANGAIGMVYHRTDGNIGWVETQTK